MRLDRISTLIFGVALVVLTCPALSAGELRTDPLESKVLGEEVRLNVLLPEGYASDESRRYPVVYLLHGYGGSYAQWAQIGVEERLAGLEVIVVMPEGRNSFWVNQAREGGERWEDYLVEEVIPSVDSRYRTVARREGRAISGLSMGGFGALALGLRHPELFASVASHSGAVAVARSELEGDVGARIEAIFGPMGSEARVANDPFVLIGKLESSRRPHIYLDCGSRDFLLESNRALVRLLAEAGVDYEYREVPGAHDFAYWRTNVRYSVERQLEALAVARPLSTEDDGASAGLPEGLASEWDAVGVLPDGSERPSVVSFAVKDGRIVGKAVGDEMTIEFSRVSFDGGRLVVEVDFEREGESLVLRVEAQLADGKLDGRWLVRDAAGAELATASWRAIPRVVAKPRRSEPPAVAGFWDVRVDYGNGQVLEYELHLVPKEGRLAGALVSPRSGKYDAESVEFDAGKLVVRVPRNYQGERVVMRFEAELKDGALSGRVVPETEGGEEATIRWSGERQSI